MNDSKVKIHFLGTAGSRYTTMSQKRASGGIWLEYKNTKLLIDPGPGSLVQIRQKTNYNPHDLDGIFLTHMHLDHSNDVNIMTVVMTNGGKDKKGILSVPQDCLGVDGVIFSYTKNLPEKIYSITGGETICVKDILVEYTSRLNHGVDVYGMTFVCGEVRIALVPDTMYFPELNNMFQCDVMIVFCLMLEKKEDVYHLCVEEAEKIIKSSEAKKAIFTHLGLKIIETNIAELEKKISANTGSEALIASDNFILEI